MITLQELCSYLHELLYNPDVVDHCPNGLQVEGRKEIGSIATAVTGSLATIELAIKKNVDALIVHHGIFWDKDSYVISGARKARIEKLLKNDISLIGWHLPLDVNEKVGNNWKAARDLGWTDLEPFGLHGPVKVGVKGCFKPMKRADFQKQLEKYYGHPAVTAFGGEDEVCSAGLVSGGAFRLIPAAAKEGLDCFITGNFDEPAWHMAMEEKVNFFSLGHSATERVGPIALANNIADKLGIKAQFLDVLNPF